MSYIENEVGERISDVLFILKKNNKISGNKDLIQDAGFSSTSSITEITKGRQDPTDDFLKVLSDKYGVNKEYILTGKKPIFHTENNESSIMEKTTGLDDKDYSVTFAEMVAANKLHAEARLLEAKNNSTILEIIKANSTVHQENLAALKSMRRHFLGLLALRDTKDGKFRSVEQAEIELDRMLFEVEQAR